MEVKAFARDVKNTVTKARIPADVVRGMMVEDALPVLKYMPKRAAHDVYKLVYSARANAIKNHGLTPENLFIAEIKVDKARRLRRYKHGSRGRVKVINRDYSNLTVVLKDIVESVSDKKDTKDTKIEDKKETKTKVKKSVKSVSTKKTVKEKTVSKTSK